MDVKIKNYYYLIAGVLAILFAVTHAWNGQSAVLPMLLVNDIAMDTRIVFRYVWHIITAENLIFGIVFIILSFQSERSKIRSAAWIIVSLLLVRLIVILGVTAYYDVSALTDTLIDSIAILIYVAFIILGIRMKKKEFGGQSAQSSRKV
ncbi:MAG: hypothetical protein E6230_25435 [Paenibacillus dendritiformis]|uniref:hypothetical protein n=1 Tax=Paenibacillus dendritiformis TaxID=130049 RepID=UPI0015611F93|nr:hypothetical protein [Paenibacillus dendritiformis]MDU5145519.1 hypothetical protein [Paenibacillus dendritiformis]NRG00107.1 hypothetical protein [Paenibacillus dendritiformis]